jgi:hypothetical protein
MAVHFKPLYVVSVTNILPYYELHCHKIPPINEEFTPTFVDWFTLSLDENDKNKYRGRNKSLLRYLHMPDLGQDLNFDLTLENKDDQIELNFGLSGNMNSFLSWIMDYEDRNGSKM